MYICMYPYIHICYVPPGWARRSGPLEPRFNVNIKMDCKVLMDGYEVFRQWMLEHTELDVDNYITIQR